MIFFLYLLLNNFRVFFIEYYSFNDTIFGILRAIFFFFGDILNAFNFKGVLPRRTSTALVPYSLPSLPRYSIPRSRPTVSSAVTVTALALTNKKLPTILSRPSQRGCPRVEGGGVRKGRGRLRTEPALPSYTYIHFH